MLCPNGTVKPFLVSLVEPVAYLKSELDTFPESSGMIFLLFALTWVAMSASPSPGAQQRRFAAYLDRLAQAAEHLDRVAPLKSYCTGLLLPGERKSVEPMAARLAPHNVRRTHQSLHHVVAHAPWSDEALLAGVRKEVLPAMMEKGPLVAWIVDDTGFVKKGQHSVGVTRQYCGQVGKQENCRVAVSLSVATEQASLPIAWRLYLPEIWAQDQQRREETGVPPEVAFQTKPQIALEQIRKAVEAGVPVAAVLADAAYGDDTKFREGVSELKLPYTVGVRAPTTVWPPGKAPLPARLGKMGRGRPAKCLRRDKNHQPVSIKQLAEALPSRKWKMLTWREGSKNKLRSRFAAVRVRPAHRDFKRSEPYPEQWLLIEWPNGESEPTKYWFSTEAADTSLRKLVKLAKHRWII